MSAPSTSFADFSGGIPTPGAENLAVERPRYIDAQVLRAKFSPSPSLRTIRSWTKARIIPSIKIGGRRFFDEAAVTAKIESRLTLLPHVGGRQQKA